MAKVTKKVSIERKPESTKSEVSMQGDLTSRIQQQFENNQSYLSLVLGLLIVFVIGILVFNYLKKHNQPNLIPAQQTTNETASDTSTPDVAVDQLPGKYTIKDGDTLFTVAKKYYNDGYKFTEIVKANNIKDENKVEVGQVLEIPKLDTQTAMAVSPTVADVSPTTAEVSPTETATPAPTVAVGSEATSTASIDTSSTGTGGSDNTTIWGDKITGDTYTIQEGDWLSKIAGRSYGDILKYKDLAAANNIPNPDKIEPGVVIKIPR